MLLLQKGRDTMKYIDSFPLEDIVISEDFRHTDPAARKIQRKVNYYKRTGELPADIIINDENVLIDGYTTYLTAVRYGFTHVPVRRGYVEIIEASYRSGSKVYTWKVPPRLQGMIHPGDKCRVRISTGVRMVTVQNILKQQYPVQTPRLRNVLKLL